MSYVPFNIHVPFNIDLTVAQRGQIRADFSNTSQNTERAESSIELSARCLAYPNAASRVFFNSGAAATTRHGQGSDAQQ